MVALLHALAAARRGAHLDLARLRRRPRTARLLRRHVQDEGRLPLQKVSIPSILFHNNFTTPRFPPAKCYYAAGHFLLNGASNLGTIWGQMFSITGNQSLNGMHIYSTLVVPVHVHINVHISCLNPTVIQ